MFGDFIYSADVSDASYKYASPRKFEKTAKWFVTLAALFLIGGLLWIFAISPCMVPAKVDVRSFSGLSRTDVLSIAGIDGKSAYVSIHAAEAERRLSSHYLVESAAVVKYFPDRVSIFLEPRRAVAMVYARVNGRIQPVYFDRYGVAIGAGTGSGEVSPALLPVISGVLDEDRPIRQGMRLSAIYHSLFSRIGAITDEDPKIWQAISEIGIAKKEYDQFDLVLYPVHDSIKLRMRSDISKDSIYYALLMFDVCRQLGDTIPDEIDIRSGIGVVNAGEGRFGK